MKSVVLYLFFTLLSSQIIFGQSQTRTGVRNVLVVPFGRFDFHTEIELAEINKINKMEHDEFYPALISAFNESFILNSGEQVNYILMEPTEFKDFMRVAKHDFSSGHYQTNLDDMKFTDYSRILDAYDCDFLLTVNWYKIMYVKRSVRIEKVKKIRKYSYHLIDYDVFNSNKINILQKAQHKFEVDITPDNYLKLGVDLLELTPVYKKMVEEISTEIYNSKN